MHHSARSWGDLGDLSAHTQPFQPGKFVLQKPWNLTHEPQASGRGGGALLTS